MSKANALKKVRMDISTLETRLKEDRQLLTGATGKDKAELEQQIEFSTTALEVARQEEADLMEDARPKTEKPAFDPATVNIPEAEETKTEVVIPEAEKPLDVTGNVEDDGIDLSEVLVHHAPTASHDRDHSREPEKVSRKALVDEASDKAAGTVLRNLDQTVRTQVASLVDAVPKNRRTRRWTAGSLLAVAFLLLVGVPLMNRILSRPSQEAKRAERMVNTRQIIENVIPPSSRSLQAAEPDSSPSTGESPTTELPQEGISEEDAAAAGDSRAWYQY